MHCELDDGKLSCNTLQTNQTEGLLIYGGAKTSAHVNSNGNITTSRSLRFDGANSTSTDAISFYDKATGTKLWSINNAGDVFCESLTV